MQSTTAALYEEDFFLWTQQQAQHLRQGTLQRIDAMNLAEEIESMGKRDRRLISHQLATILLHLLEGQHLPDWQGKTWRCALHDARQELGWILTDSPSLCHQLTALVDATYPGARRRAADEMGLPLATFPAHCPFMLEQILDEEWPA